MCVCPQHHSHELATLLEPSKTHSCERSKARKMLLVVDVVVVVVVGVVVVVVVVVVWLF